MLASRNAKQARFALIIKLKFIKQRIECNINFISYLQKVEPVSNIFYLVEGFALVMLCNCRLYPRRLAVHILREIKLLLKTLGNYIICITYAMHYNLVISYIHCIIFSGAPEDDQPVIDVIDACCPVVLEKCYPMLPPAEKAAAASTSNVDLQWIADRSSCVWTAGNTSFATFSICKSHYIRLYLFYVAGFHDENSTKSSSSLNLNGADPWASCLFAFLEKDRVLTLCPNAVAHSWPIVFTRINSLFSVVDPT